MKERLALTKDDIAERLAWFLVAALATDLATKFHKHGIWFYKLKEKLALTKNDIAERLPWFLVAAFAKHLATKSRGRPALAGMTASAKQMKPG